MLHMNFIMVITPGVATPATAPVEKKIFKKKNFSKLLLCVTSWSN